MKIAVFTDLYLEISGGIPSSISAQKKALEKLGHEVVVFCPGRKCAEENVVLLPTAKLKINGAPMARSPRKIVKFVEQKYPNFGQEFDVIHAHYEAEVSIAAVMLARRYKMHLVQTMHGREDMAVAINVPFGVKILAGKILNGLHGHYLKKFCGVPIKIRKDDYLAPTIARAKMWELMVRQANCADLVLTPSQHFAEKLKNYGVRKEIEVLSNGVPDELIEEYDYKVRKLDESYSRDGEKLRIIWTARVSHEKRMMPFLEALSLLRDKTDKFFLTVLGDGNELGKARKYVKTHSLESNVEFAGAKAHDEVLAALANQHLSITNSYGFDTQGLTLLEATATGLPVVYCDPDMDGVVLPGTGIRAKDSTPVAMQDVLLCILDHPEKIEEMSKNAFSEREKVLQSFWIKKLITYYEQR